MNNTNDKPAPWHPDQIRGTLMGILGRRYAALLAQKAGKSNSWVSRHICGTLATSYGRDIIASAIGVKTAVIWPEADITFQEKAA